MQREKQDEHGNLPDEVTVSVGMSVMITFNVETNMEMANGSRDEITAIALREEDGCVGIRAVVNLSEPPVYVLVELQSRNVPSLPGLKG